MKFACCHKCYREKTESAACSAAPYRGTQCSAAPPQAVSMCAICVVSAQAPPRLMTWLHSVATSLAAAWSVKSPETASATAGAGLTLPPPQS